MPRRFNAGVKYAAAFLYNIVGWLSVDPGRNNGEDCVSQQGGGGCVKHVWVLAAGMTLVFIANWAYISLKGYVRSVLRRFCSALR